MNNKKVISFIAVLLAVLMALTLVLSVLPTVAYAVEQEDIDAVEAQKAELSRRTASVESRLAQLKEDQAAAIEQKAALDEQCEILREQIALTDEQIELYTRMIEEKALEVAEAKRLEDEQYERYCVRLRAMEEQGNYDYLVALITAESFAALLGLFDDIDEIMESDKLLEQKYIKARETHERIKAEYEETEAKLEEKKLQLGEEKADLEERIQEATELIAKLGDDIEKAKAEYEAALAAEAAAAAQVTNLIAQLNAQNAAIAAQKAAAAAAAQSEESQGESEAAAHTESASSESSAPGAPAEPATTTTTTTASSDSGIYSAATAGVTGSGSLMWPVPSGMVVTSRFGNRLHPITGEWRYHSGMDIDGYGHDGGAIVACDSGVVVTATYNSGYGNYIIIDHGNGMQTLYAHMSGFAVSYGDTVYQGQTIGYLGSTGWATGTHCHLEIFVNGSRVDPEGYFSGMSFYDC